MTWWNIIKAKRISGGGRKTPSRQPSKRRGGRTIEGGSTQDKMNRLTAEYSKGKMSLEQYIKRRDKILGKDKK